ncbi:hypothetical protein LEP1GSC050_3513 [Leptospira broomii serovar Hurstbridge str. 5399]|uniref:Uncharacterized protein n=1 Tax=Leptospira broomii serovar Hurstbridge str. 5399 TaxID=1049789 RepID=T0GBT6_9LEPT|nr:hypothetical protein LEP1GSC050_3513 [Leptospira broomii serovar Hurstbridge str. 5399]
MLWLDGLGSPDYIRGRSIQVIKNPSSAGKFHTYKSTIQMF